MLTLTLLISALGAGSRLGASNDPLFPRQWGIERIGADKAWAVSKGAGVTIAVSDTGVDLKHEDLAGKVIEGRDYVDGGPPQDGHYHGTHIAGIAGAITGNGKGVAGVAPDAKILAIRVFDDDGQYAGGGADSIRYAADNGARVINLSWGPILSLGGLFDDPAVDSAVRYAFDKGSVVVVSSGNDGNPFSNPATSEVSLVVGATTRLDQKAAYSTAGPGVRIYAPGGDVTDVIFCEDDDNILSTVPPGSSIDCRGDGYDTLSGTSMAAPHVAGTAALVLAKKPSLSAGQVIDILISTADSITGGLKRVNAEKAVAAAGSPTSGAGSGGGQSPSGGGSTPGGGSAAPGGGATGAPGESPGEEGGSQETGGGTEGTDGVEGFSPDSPDEQDGAFVKILLGIAVAFVVIAAAGLAWTRLRPTKTRS